MNISLSSLIKILHAAFPTDSIAINPMFVKKKYSNHVCIEIEYGPNMGSVAYDTTNDLMFSPSPNFSRIIETAIGETQARQLRQHLKKMEEESNKTEETVDILDVIRAEGEGMPSLANLM